MRIIDIPVAQLIEAPWNPNAMTPDVKANLKSSVHKYGNAALRCPVCGFLMIYPRTVSPASSARLSRR